MKDTEKRKGKIITLGVDARANLPQVFDTIYKLQATPVADDDDVTKDETAKLHTLITIDVEGVVVVDGGNAVMVNGCHKIPVIQDEDYEPKGLLNKYWKDEQKAIAAWEYVTDMQIKKHEELEAKIKRTLHALRTSREERQY